MYLSAEQKKFLLSHAKAAYSMEALPGLIDIPPRLLFNAAESDDEIRDVLEMCISLQQWYWENEAKKAVAEGDSIARTQAQFMLTKIYNSTMDTPVRKDFMSKVATKTSKSYIVAKKDQVKILDDMIKSKNVNQDFPAIAE